MPVASRATGSACNPARRPPADVGGNQKVVFGHLTSRSLAARPSSTSGTTTGRRSGPLQSPVRPRGSPPGRRRSRSRRLRSQHGPHARRRADGGRRGRLGTPMTGTAVRAQHVHRKGGWECCGRNDQLRIELQQKPARSVKLATVRATAITHRRCRRSNQRLMGQELCSRHDRRPVGSNTAVEIHRSSMTVKSGGGIHAPPSNAKDLRNYQPSWRGAIINPALTVFQGAVSSAQCSGLHDRPTPGGREE